MTSGLTGKTILVTRPEHQAGSLIKAIEQAGGTAVLFPVIEILPVDNQQAIRRCWKQVAGYHWLVFISANAVNFAASLNGGRIILPKTVKVAAIGQATARALQRHNIPVSLLPDEGYNSEALLKMADWQQLPGQRFLIVRGVGGREKLAETLKQRGAAVDYLEVYRRNQPRNDPQRVKKLLDRNALSAIVLTSGEAVKNLWDILDQDKTVLSIPLVVISSRIAQIASRLGFEKIKVSQGPSEAAIIESLKTLNNGEERG
jgi:uroporphyrinogen-III synthase